MMGFVGKFLYGSFIIWQRDMKRMLRDKHQFYGSFARPVLWLLVLGMGLRPVFKENGGVDYLQFIFPGIVAMSLIFSAMWSGISIIWDREFGFLKEILVAPIPRTSIVTGKIMGGATQAMVQGGITLLFAPLIGVKITHRGFFCAPGDHADYLVCALFNGHRAGKQDLQLRGVRDDQQLRHHAALLFLGGRLSGTDAAVLAQGDREP